MREVLTGPRSPWQNADVEQSMGPLDESVATVIVVTANHLRRVRGDSAIATVPADAVTTLQVH